MSFVLMSAEYLNLRDKRAIFQLRKSANESQQVSNIKIKFIFKYFFAVCNLPERGSSYFQTNNNRKYLFNMKTIAIILAMIIGISSANAADTTSTADKKMNRKTEALKQAMKREVNQHIFFPTSAGEVITGSADVTFQIMPEGQIKVVAIKSESEAVNKFIIKQTEKMNIGKDNTLVGEVFKYRFVFKRQA